MRTLEYHKGMALGCVTSWWFVADKLFTWFLGIFGNAVTTSPSKYLCDVLRMIAEMILNPA
jgi:hypothetical protein